MVVGCVRSMRESTSSVDYLIEDGTGSISGKCWQDKAGAPVSYFSFSNITMVGTVNGQEYAAVSEHLKIPKL